MPAEPARRGLLQALATFALGATAGCAAAKSPRSEPGTAAPTEPPTAPPTRTNTDLPDRTVAFPDGPKEPPTRPGVLTEQSVRSYVEAFEYRYVYNQLWLGPSTVVHLECTVERVTDIGVGYRVLVSCTGWSESAEVHADYFTQQYVYHLDEDSIVRQYAGTGTPTPNSPTPQRGR